jgi:hypothetical protein
VLQGVEGLRARGAVVRIIEVPMESAKGYQADVYAEGDVKTSGQDHAQAERRAVFRTRTQVKLSPYDRSGLSQLDRPPRGLPILHRSGFEPPESPPEAKAPTGTTPAAGPVAERPATDPAVTAATVAAAPIVSPPPPPPDLEPVPVAALPKRDAMVERAQGNGPAVKPTQAQVPRVEQVVPPTVEAQPPEVDLPPIDGA